MAGYENIDDELSLSDYLQIARRRWLWIFLPLLIVLGAVTALTLNQTLVYRATAAVQLSQSEAQKAIQGNSNVGVANRDLANEINFAQSDVVSEAATTKLGEKSDVSIERDPEADLLYFTASSTDPNAAAQVANTWAEVYVDIKQQQAAGSIAGAIEAFEADLADGRSRRQGLRAPLDSLEDRLATASTEESRALLQGQVDRMRSDLEVELELLDTELTGLSSSITELQVASQLARNGTATVIQQAFPPQQPSNPPLSRNLVLGGVVGLILGAAAALIVDNLDRTIKSSEDISSSGLAVVGVIPKPNRALSPSQIATATMNHSGTPIADGYQKVRTAIEFSLLGREIKSLLITSANQAEGKTSTSSNLAWAMSAVGHRVILADVDFRRPRVHEVFGCPAEPGLSDNLLHGTPLSQLALRVDDDQSDLVVLPTGASPPSPGDFVASPAFHGLLKNLETKADLVILDAPPVLPVSDAISIARNVDAVVLVARAGATTKQDLSSTAETLRRVGASILGVCLVGADAESGAYGYGYGPASDHESWRSRRKASKRKKQSAFEESGDWYDPASSNGSNIVVGATTPSTGGSLPPRGH